MKAALQRGALTLALVLASSVSHAASIQWPSFLWNDPGLAPALKELKSTFEQENPEDHINSVLIPVSTFWDKQFADVSNGNPPDIGTFYDSDVRNYIEQGLLEPLDNYLSAASIDRSSFVPTASLGQKDGHVYAVPVVVNARALFYNDKLFRDAGIEPPKDARTFLDAAKTLRKPEAQQFGFATASKPGNASLNFIETSPLIVGFGGGYFKDGKPSANSPETIAALRFYKQLFDENLIPRGVETGVYRDMFAHGKVGMYATGSFIASVVEGADKDVYKDLRATPLPFPGGQTVSVTVFLGVPKGAKNKDAAAAVLMRMLKSDFQLRIAQIGKAYPGRVNMLPRTFFDQNPWFKAFENASLTAHSYAPDGVEQYGPEIIKIVSEGLENMLFQGVSPEETANNLQQKLTDFIATKK
ncbi:sugar ABC transporter substrate-binding protein [Mesorhizobium sp.]|uniref:ABC transporter substrate-binding protein n=1 Tax=Mesorhizobium sp. TaxID=1871066 RepID=UPI001203C2CB|nr:sugar ABC transporter substrate-binding protein [Mesorhizobium sp.]TIU42717.1 MAG: sugar ABC transporter substrate-binding protein [Mesorhizobium sp.]TIV62397.1 MAG: sugar ABC transporter substrate-binding protein [Mesorhizobium sp.]